MSDRPPNPGDVPMACPFIAFEDDRQRRSTQPDRRHRCYAETPAAPRAISHQETYCLTGNFPACPTFQDWARREAARSVAGEVRNEAPAGRTEDALAYLAANSSAASSHLWGGGPEQLSAFDAPGSDPGTSPGEAGHDSGGGTGPSGPADAELAELVRRPGPGASGRGVPGEPGVAAVGLGRASGAGPSGGRSAGFDAPEDEDEGDEGTPAFLAARARGAAAFDETAQGRASGGPTSSSRGTRPPMAARTPPHRPIDPDAPAWERPRRFEAYPTLRTRTGLGAISPVLLGAAALVIAALVLFVLPGFLSGSGQPGATSTPTTAASATAVATPTVPPASAPPTPLVYVVKAGDTLSAIASRYDTTVDAIKAANPQIKDINKIGIGDQITIPTPPPASPSAAVPTAPGSSTEAP